MACPRSRRSRVFTCSINRGGPVMSGCSPTGDGDLMVIVSAIRTVFIREGIGVRCPVFLVETTVKSPVQMLAWSIRGQDDSVQNICRALINHYAGLNA
ncbi:hypothetical protein Rcae01_06627 [Novipirellula caenicola]|uniref:LysR family transcriptional regulator n=1 Tax=Novipirellula caenicola TaxID=1536901 RepID=A0ABP9W167_9BACT